MKTLNEISKENNGVFPFLAARAGQEWSIVYDRVRYSNENDDDAKPEESVPVKNGYFYLVKTDETIRSIASPDMRVWERWQTVRSSRQIRDVFDKHQETCESCGLGNVPIRCPAAETIRHLYYEFERKESA